jgi:glycine/D-amino acid oxidase-like deaminating enzyme
MQPLNFMKPTPSSLNSSDIDLLVLGGGILGVGVAALAAALGYSVMLIRLGDEDRPQAETLRNQGWLQSGMMYVNRFKGNRKAGLKLAKKMYAWGHTMLTRLGIPIPDENNRAILRVRTPQEGVQILSDARDLKISKFVRQLAESESQAKLGSLFEEGSLYYSLPDIPFDEAAVLEVLRQNAVSDEALLLNTKTPARLIPDSGVAGRFNCEWEGGTLSPRVTVLAAGAGNYPLLEQLGVSPPMTLRQTPLLVVRDELSTTVPIYADRTRGFSFVRQSLHTASGGAALVVGTNVHRDNVPFRAAVDRRISEKEVEDFKKCLPPVLEACVSTGRFTAGYELIPDSSVRKGYFEDWVTDVGGYPGLIMASPGRATLGLMTAQQVVRRASKLLGAPSPSKGRDPSLVTTSSWDDEIHMHFEDYYSFDDSKKDEEL